MVAFSLRSINVYRYGIFYAITMLVVRGFIRLVVAKQILYAKYPKIHNLLAHHTEDILLYAILGVLIGGRLGEIFIYNFDYYRTHPFKVFAIHEGGMSFIGGIIGVSVALWYMKRKFSLRRRDISLLGSTIASIIPFGSMIGRIGNFLNQELFGIPAKEVLPYLTETTKNILTNLHIFHIYPQIDTILRVNTNFLASFGEGLLLLIIMQILFWSKENKTYLRTIRLFGYSFVRFLLEYLRQDSQSEIFLYLSRSQWFFLLAMIGCGVFWLFWGYKKIKKTQVAKP